MELDINSAITKGFFQQVRFLVRFGHGVNKRDAAGRTPLINSAFIEDDRWAIGLARNLIESGARVGVTDRIGVNALHYACKLGRAGLVQIFLKAIDYDLNQPDRYGNSALHYAVSGDNSDVVKLLLDTAAKYGIPTDTENQFGMTPLSQALECQYDRCVYLLRQASNMKDSIGVTTSTESLTERRTPTHGMSNGFDVNTSSLSNGRPTSGPLLVRRQRSHTGRLSNSNGNVKELVATSLPVNGSYTGHLIRASSVTNLRNLPEYIMQVSPSRWFAGEHPCNPLPISTAIGNDNDNDAANWRQQLKQLYATYGYQFAPSYRKGAPPIDRMLYVDDEFGIPRPISPNPSESDAISELSKRMSRRGSVVSGKFEPSRARRNSIMGMRNGRTSSTADSCSESETSSYAYKPGRKSAASDDGTPTSDKSSKHSKLDKAKSKSRKISTGDKKNTDEHPTRPLSRAGHHAKDVGSRAGHHAKDATVRVGHHAKDAATNMNAVADQLGAIKEYQE